MEFSREAYRERVITSYSIHYTKLYEIAEAEAQVAKILRYRRSPPPGPATKHLLLAEVLFPRNWTAGQLVQVDGAATAESLRARGPACVAFDRYYENATRRVIFAVVIGGIYLGVFHPTEGAAFGAFGTARNNFV